MNSTFNIVEGIDTKTTKKLWSKPVFEIISKDVIKSAPTSTFSEGTSAHAAKAS